MTTFARGSKMLSGGAYANISATHETTLYFVRSGLLDLAHGNFGYGANYAGYWTLTRDLVQGFSYILNFRENDANAVYPSFQYYARSLRCLSTV